MHMNIYDVFSKMQCMLYLTNENYFIENQNLFINFKNYLFYLPTPLSWRVSDTGQFLSWV